MMEFLKGKDAAKKLGICQQTLRKYADNGIIKYKRLPSGHRIYDIHNYLEGKEKIETINNRIDICYCKVSNIGH